MDSNIPITADLVADSDAHLFSALLKSYLRELPVPFLGREDKSIYDKWIEVANLSSSQQRVDGIREILSSFPENVSLNIQYLVKFIDDYIYLPLSSLSLTSWRALAAERQSVIPLLATRRRHYADLWHEQAQQEELGRFLDAWDVDRYGTGGHDSD